MTPRESAAWAVCKLAYDERIADGDPMPPFESASSDKVMSAFGPIVDAVITGLFSDPELLAAATYESGRYALHAKNRTADPCQCSAHDFPPYSSLNPSGFTKSMCLNRVEAIKEKLLDGAP